jgi:O-antigen/teichoic acid export membrane protein
VLARNSALNAAGIALPLALGFFLLPVLAHELGAARFGVLALAWALLEYLGLFDIGIGRATTRLVADALPRSPSEVSQIVARGLVMQTLLGTLGGILLVAATPAILSRVLELPPALAAEARSTFFVVGATLPIVLVSVGLRSVIEAAERFDLAALIRVPSASSTFVVPAAAAWLGADLPRIMLLLLATRVLTVIALGAAAQRAVPELRFEVPRHWGRARSTLAFGGWLTFSNLANPVFLYLDRFVLGAVVGVAAVGFYTSPFELTFRALLIPMGITGALFPHLSAALGAGNERRVEQLYGRSLRYLGIVMLPVGAVMLVGASTLLTLWLGPEFAANSADAMRILGVGLVANALAQVPTTYLHALGRPDVCAKGHAAELVLHVPMTFALVHAFGIAGAAAAWTLRVTIDVVYLLLATRRVAGLGAGSALLGRVAPAAAALAALALGLGAGAAAGLRTATGLGVAGAGLALYALVTWRFVLDEAERASVASLLPRPAARATSESGA